MASKDNIIFQKEVYNKYYPIVSSVTRRRLMAMTYHDDAIQSTFLLYLKEKEKGQINSELSSWFYWATINVCKSINREIKKRSKMDEKSKNQKNASSDSNHALNIEFDKVLEKLPEKKRALLLMKFFDNKSNKEIAKYFGASEESIKKMINRTIQNLKEKLNIKDVVFATAFSNLFLFQSTKSNAMEAPPSLQINSFQRKIVESISITPTSIISLKLILISSLAIILPTIALTTLYLNQEPVLQKEPTTSAIDNNNTAIKKETARNIEPTPSPTGTPVKELTKQNKPLVSNPVKTEDITPKKVIRNSPKRPYSFDFVFTKKNLEDSSVQYNKLIRIRKPTADQKKERAALRKALMAKSYKKETFNIDLEGEITGESFLHSFLAKTQLGMAYFTKKTNLKQKFKIKYHKKNILPDKALFEILFEFGFTYTIGIDGHYNVFPVNSVPDIIKDDKLEGTMISPGGALYGEINFLKIRRRKK